MLDITNGPVPATLHKWEPIEDLPANWRDLCRPDLHAVHRQWVSGTRPDQGPGKTPGSVSGTACDCVWAIETGIIERLYTVDRGVTVQILEAGLASPWSASTREGRLSTEARALIADQRAALGDGDGYGRRNPRAHSLLSQGDASAPHSQPGDV